MKADKVVFIDKELEKAIKRAIQSIEQDFSVGRNVKKNLIPKKLIDKYSINNLWIYDLPSAWRLLYSITSNEIEIIAVVLDWMNHKNYERLVNF